MQYLKKAALLLLTLSLSVGFTAPAALASVYDYYVWTPVDEVEPAPVDNSGTFGLPVEVFRGLCEDTDGEWDVVNGRHVCYCWEGEFNWPDGCPEVDPYFEDPYFEDDYYYEDYPNDPYFEDDYYFEDDPYYDEDLNTYYQKENYPFYDLAGHPDEYYVLELMAMGIIQGYPDGTFRPDQPVNRAEMTKMAMMAARLEPINGDEDRKRFFSDLDNWQAPWVNAAYRLDIVEGFSGYNSGIRLFKPNVWVNRVEGVKLVLASFGRLPHDLEKTSFVDTEGWMVPWLEDAYRIGLIDRDYTGRFYPADPMTRGMAARVIFKMLQYAGDI
jgi:hypothetical protein